MPNWLVGIDIGGTFTDVAAAEAETGRLLITKVPSTPIDPSQAVVDGLTGLLQSRPEIGSADIRFFAHGTTVATNALIEMKGATAGLLINRGFRGTYELRGGTRPSGSDLVDTFYQKPAALIPQKMTEEIGGRIAFDGSEIEPLDEDGVRGAVRRLRDRGASSIAVCYLFSFMNPAHERRTAEIIRQEFPECRVSLSSLVLPVIREYPRISTTVLDAYVGPVTATYLERLAKRLEESGLTTKQLFIMQSNGGLMRLDVAAHYPNQTLLSGPAAGVLFGSAIGDLTGERNVVTFDMGGTSTDISVMPNNAFQETRTGKIAGQDIGTPMIDIRTLGAGGGTIAWLGPDGLLKAGPHSAGAAPGPACYGRGGHEPTVTDADLLLGYLDPAGLIGGRVQLNRELARRAIQERLAGPLSMSVDEAALGVVRVVNVNIEVGLRLSLMERGLDPRQFALVAFGGAGPVHAAWIARDLGIPRVVVPPNPGISCAMGLLQTDVRHYYMQSRLAPLTKVGVEELEAIFEQLEKRALTEAQEEGFEGASVRLLRQVDLRYPYQGYELTVPCPSGALTEVTKEDIRRAFDRLHQDIYGISAPEEVPDVVNLRVISTSPVPRLELPPVEATGDALMGERAVLFQDHAERVRTPVYRRDGLPAGSIIEGPAIVEQLDSTTVLLAGQKATVGERGTLIVAVEAE